MERVLPDKFRKSWAKSTVRGFGYLACGRASEAATSWLDSEAAIPVAALGFESLVAASRANAGAAHLLRGGRAEAERCFGDAAQAWQEVIASVATLDVPMTGASSSFHFRLAANGPDALLAARRDRYRQLAQSALAIVQFNGVLARDKNFASEATAEHAVELKAQLSHVFGGLSPEVRLLSLSLSAEHPNKVAAIYADKVSDLQSRPQTFAATLSEACAQLEIAVALTALLTPPIFRSIEADAKLNQHTQLEFE